MSADAPRARWGEAGHPDQIVFRTSLVTIGAFRCAVHEPEFHDSGPIPQPCFVFPRTAVTIQYPDRPAFVADPNVVTFFNAGQQYRRRPVSRDGDRCDWYAIDPTVVREAVRRLDPAAADDDRPLRQPFAISASDLYLRQRRLFQGVRRADIADPLVIEESVCALLDRALAGLSKARPVPADPHLFAPRRRIDMVDATQRLLAIRFAESLSLVEIASIVGASPYHLSRSFHDVTGLTLHRYRDRFRLRAALELMEAGQALTDIAFDVGYPSHSHFTLAFRQEFGVPPSHA